MSTLLTMSSIRQALKTLEESKLNENVIGEQIPKEKRIESLENHLFHTKKILLNIIELMESKLTLDQINKL